MNWKQVKSIKIKEGDVKSLSINSQVVWSKEEVPPEPPVEDHRFRFYNPGDQVNTLSNSGSPSFETSTDGVNWTPDAVFTSMDIQPKGTLYLRGKNANMKQKTFSSTHPIECHGSVMDLCDGGVVTYYHFSHLFANMSTLLTAPKLPANKLANSCYQYMFYGCTSLKEAPELPATELADSCYKNMFQNCTSLKEAPELPATTLVPYCYQGMFSNCESLVKAPVIPAMTLANYCYREMFSSCKSLVQAPELPATKLQYECYSSMFQYCSNLKWIKIGCTNWISGWISNWVYGVAPTGTFVKPLTLQVGDVVGQIPLNSTSGIPSGWTVEDINPEPPVEDHRFRFKNVSGVPNTVKLVKGGNGPTITLEKSGNGVDYVPCDIYAGIELQANEVVYLRGVNKQFASGMYDYNSFTSTKNIECHGSIMDICDGGANTTVIGVMRQLRGLFLDMTNLLTAPELPATTLAQFAYEYLFYGCKSLKKAPKLPASDVSKNPYKGMFQNCPNINSVEVGATNWNPQQDWLKGAASVGDIIAPNLTWDTFNNDYNSGGVPRNWTLNGEVKPEEIIPPQDPVSSESFCLTNTQDKPASVQVWTLLENTTFDNLKFIVSKDGVNWRWMKRKSPTSFEEIPIANGEKLYIRGKDNVKLNDYDSFNRVQVSGSGVECSGNIGDLTNNELVSYKFKGIFADSEFRTLPTLPYFNNLPSSIYRGLFANCHNIYDIPYELNFTFKPGTANNCDGMFSGCNNLTGRQILTFPPNGITQDAYSHIFEGTNISTVDLGENVGRFPGSRWNENAANNWLVSTSTGDIIAPYLSIGDIPVGPNGVPEGWTLNGVLPPQPTTGMALPYEMDFDNQYNPNGGEEIFTEVGSVPDNHNTLVGGNPSGLVWPNNWDVVRNGDFDYQNVVYVRDDAAGDVSTGNSLYCNSISGAGYVAVALPKFNVPLNQIKIEFYARVLDNYPDVFKLGYMTDINEIFTFEEITLDSVQEGSGKIYSADLSTSYFDTETANAARLVFKFDNQSSYNTKIWVDNIKVTQV